MDRIEPKQRMLRRLYFLENFGYMYKEMMYGRKFHEDMKSPRVILWKWDEEEGKNASPL